MNAKKIIIVALGVLISVFLAADVFIFVQGRKSVAHVNVEEKKPVEDVEGETFEIVDTMDDFLASDKSEEIEVGTGDMVSGGEEDESAVGEEPVNEAPVEEAAQTEMPAEQESADEVSAENDSEYIFADSDSRRLKKSDLKGMSKKELKFARNELYARHGYIFKDKSLAKYFEGKSWYTGTIKSEDFKDSERFNDIEIANRDLILKYEKKGK